MKKLIPILMLLVLLCASTPALASGNTSSARVDPFRGAWGGTLTHRSPNGIINAQLNLYFNESVPGDELGSFKASGYSSITWEEPNKPKRAKATLLPMMAKYVDMGDGTYDVTILATLPLPPWAPITGISIYKLEGMATIPGSGVADNVIQGMWYTKTSNGSIISDPWSAVHLDRRNVKSPKVQLDNSIYFVGDVLATLFGPATVPPNERNPHSTFNVGSNIVMDSCQVTFPDGRSLIIPSYTDVFSPQVDFVTSFRFWMSMAGEMPLAGEYTITALDVAGKPIPGIQTTDVWVGVMAPDPPTNTILEVVDGDGLLFRWDPVDPVPGSFEPASHIGTYKINLQRVPLDGGAWELVYGGAQIFTPFHLIPESRADFGPSDVGSPISEWGDGTYQVSVAVQSVAPVASDGHGWEYDNTDPAQNWIFDIEAGMVVNLRKMS